MECTHVAVECVSYLKAVLQVWYKINVYYFKTSNSSSPFSLPLNRFVPFFSAQPPFSLSSPGAFDRHSQAQQCIQGLECYFCSQKLCKTLPTAAIYRYSVYKIPVQLKYWSLFMRSKISRLQSARESCWRQTLKTLALGWFWTRPHVEEWLTNPFWVVFPLIIGTYVFSK